MNHEEFRRVFEKSGLTKSELGYIFQVSRQTIYDWYKGTEPKQAGVGHRFEIYTAALNKAMSKKALPMPTGLTKQVRQARLLTIATQLHGLIKPTQPR